MNKLDDSLLWTHYYLHGEDRNCYLIGSKLEGKYVSGKDSPLNNKEVLMTIEEILPSIPRYFRTESVPFVWNAKAKLYHTEKMLEVPVAVAGNNFANLRADLVVRNALVARVSLENLVK